MRHLCWRMWPLFPRLKPLRRQPLKSLLLCRKPLFIDDLSSLM